MSSSASVSRISERKSQFERSDICAAAFQLFLNQGYESTTAEEIARASGISRRTFFRYFETKEDVVVAALADSEQFLLELIGRQPESQSPIATLRSALTECVDYYQKNAAKAREAHLLIHSNEKLKGRYLASRDRLRGEIAALLIRRSVSEPEAEIAAAASLGVLSVALDRWRHDPDVDISSALNEGFDQLLAICYSGK